MFKNRNKKKGVIININLITKLIILSINICLLLHLKKNQ